jgi:hypothetical protein
MISIAVMFFSSFIAASSRGAVKREIEANEIEACVPYFIAGFGERNKRKQARGTEWKNLGPEGHS